jgi:hypothetical protein
MAEEDRKVDKIADNPPTIGVTKADGITII